MSRLLLNITVSTCLDFCEHIDLLVHGIDEVPSEGDELFDGVLVVGGCDKIGRVSVAKA